MTGGVVREAGNFTEIPALHQALGQLPEAGAEHGAHRLIDVDTRLGQGRGQFVGLLATTAPKSQLAQVIEQGRDKYFFLMFRKHVACDIACLHRRMERARQQFLQLLARGAGKQAIDQAHRQADQPYIIEADQHNGPRDGTDGFLRRVVINAITNTQHLGGQRRIT
ncbi:hypothetical protein D9M68_766190 [compost metagenome]